MKKLFLVICFICLAMPSLARVSNFDEAMEEHNQPQKIENIDAKDLPNPKNIEEVREFFKKRFQTVSISNSADLGDLNKTNAMDVQHSAEYVKEMQENEKSAFQKIYERALGRIDEPDAEISPDTVFYEEVKATAQNDETKLPQIPLVDVVLPNGQQILAPAREHIPYMITSYAIQPTGTIDVVEDVIVVANAQKLKNGLIKMMPKYTTSRTGVKKKLDITLISVSVNGKDIAYKLEEMGDSIYIKPNQSYVLVPGVYGYRFHYLLDRKLWYYKDFTEFYADVTGSYLNLVIASANAVVSVPDGRTFTSATAMVGYPSKLDFNRAIIAYLDQNALGIASTTPLNVGEGMHILVSLDKNIFIEPSLGRRFVWLITDYGDILFALLGLLSVFGSYYFSWKYIKENKSRLNIKFKQTAPLNRYIVENTFDERSFVSALLELVRHKLIDIQIEGKNILLIKKTDILKKASSGLKKVMKQLFGKHESSIAVSSQNVLKFQRAYKLLKKSTQKTFKILTLKLNGFYLAFSLSMLLLTCIAVSYIAINPVEMGLILFSSVLTLAFYLWILRRPFTSKIMKYILKSLAVFFVLATIILLSVYIHFLSALFITAIVWTIIEFSHVFTAKDGLIKNKKSEFEALKKYLQINAAQISKSSEFEIEQPNIFAFGLEDQYKQNDKNKMVYKLDVAGEILRFLSNKTR